MTSTLTNRMIYESILEHLDGAPDTSTGRINMRFDGFKVTCNNDMASIAALAAKFKRPHHQHTHAYQIGKMASQGSQVRREPISRMVARYPEDREAFELLD